MKCVSGVTNQAAMYHHSFGLIKVNRVGTWEINEAIVRPAANVRVYRAARDVGGMRSKSTEFIEECGLANIGLAHKRDGL
jgi:hypothetical protein|tara:strand:- start:204 stop:443 length:240 start_codon:yes stop_codon:yes gene_type:complete